MTFLIRQYGGFPEGVCYAILFMNCLSPLIEMYVKPRRFGVVRAKSPLPRPAAEAKGAAK